jgi:hypothetical protein
MFDSNCPLRGGKPVLYHLGRDPGETDDSAASEPGRVTRMVVTVNRHRQPTAIFPNLALDRVSRQ